MATLMPLFPELSDDARVWIYAADRALGADEQAALRDALDAFCRGWTSHARPVRGAAEILEDRFVIVAGEIPGGTISGCGIDASVHAVGEAAERLGITWITALDVLYRDANGIQSVPRPVFRRLVREGRVDGTTPVFDPSVDTLGALRAGAFERPAGSSWHARVFRIGEPAT